MKYILLALFLVGCTYGDPKPHITWKYELSTDKKVAIQQCNDFFKKFHGKYKTVKSYGKVEKVSTLQFYAQPNCGSPCFTSEFYYECSFLTNDDDRGILFFQSDMFQDYK